MTNKLKTIEKPCTVQTQQGFSVLYKDRYLYSRYAPSAAIIKFIENLTLLPDTLILCYAPALGYGLRELIEKMPPGCHILTVDFDKQLYDFFREKWICANSSLADDKRISSVLLASPAEIAKILNDGKFVPPPGSFKRAAIVKMSGGTAFCEEAYTEVTEYADNFIQTFWKNHITLTRMGRMYALDVLKNLKMIEFASCSAHNCGGHANLEYINNIQFLQLYSVSKPILVIGAGLSTDNLLPALYAPNNDFFILCVDAALPALLQNGIRPDAVVAVESQLAIEKAYIGAAESGIHVIADLTSRPRVTRLCGGNVSFFLSEYCTLPFMKELTNAARSLGIPVFPPLGSVGLYAVEIALYLRKPGTPVFVCGLDFSFVPGQTHCKGAPAHTASLVTADRLRPAGTPAAAYNHTAHPIVGKTGRTEYTDAALSGYGALYAKRYQKVSNLFDCAVSGMQSGIQGISRYAMFSLIESLCDYEEATEPIFAAPAASQPECRYVENQLKKLSRIKAILTGSEEPRSDTELEELIAECGYLYAHFPDCAAGFRMTQDFLNRIRAEVDVFLKAGQ
ncbi:MAG: DUF115 domain-containing protein [Spirochaetaceae bacterium]|nr:DUF115 domain-containing protein [Spirochaetaceae bacterium]